MSKGKSFTIRDIEQLAASGFIRGYCAPSKPTGKGNGPKKGEGAGNGRRKSKYGSERVEVDGLWFQSRREAKRYGELIMLLKAGDIAFLERQTPYELNEGGTHSLKYFADFRYWDVKKSEWVIEDAKGFATKEFKKKKKLMKKLYGIDVMEV